jgi:IMP dehydrogenase
MVINPITINPSMTLSKVRELMDRNGYSGFPVVEDGSGKLVGILTNRDVRFASNPDQLVSELMTANTYDAPLVTVSENTDLEEAKHLLHQHRIEKLVVVDDNFRCIGLITVKDMEKAQAFPNACKDEKGRLRVAAATGVGDAGLERTEALLGAEVDVIVVDTAHGHSSGVLSSVTRIKKLSNYTQVIAGKVAGVGMPQFTAVLEAAEVCAKAGIPVIADGGIKYSGDVAKAVAAGADCVMIGSLFAGTEESPGEVFLFQGRSYKSYRGMGSIGAMSRGSADRYFQQEVSDTMKYVPEGVEGRVPYKGPVTDVVHQLVGGLRASMGYTGNADVDAMKTNCRFRRITAAGLREGHVHDVTITREAPNYRLEN